MQRTANTPAHSHSQRENAPASSLLNSQECFDRFGFVLVPDVIDMNVYGQETADLHCKAQALAEKYLYSPEERGTTRFVFPAADLSINYRHGLTQIFIEEPLNPSYFHNYLLSLNTYYQDKPVRFVDTVPFPYMQQIETASRNAPSTSADRRHLDLDQWREVADFYQAAVKFGRAFSSNRPSMFVYVLYQPGVGIADHESETYHRDKVIDVATRAIGLVGDMHCRAGVDEADTVEVARSEGSEIVLDNFSPKDRFHTIHNFVNTSPRPSFSLVIDEADQRGRDYLISRGVTSFPARELPAHAIDASGVLREIMSPSL